MLWDQIVDSCPDDDSDNDIRSYLFDGIHNLIFCIIHTVCYCKRRRSYLHIRRLPDKICYLVFHMQPFNDRSPYNSYDKSNNHISKCDLPSKDTHQKNQRSQIYHRRRNQKRKGNSQRQSRTGESHKNRNR